jgi:hypothetical protein
MSMRKPELKPVQPRFSGVNTGQPRGRNRCNGFWPAPDTADAVPSSSCLKITPLERGVNGELGRPWN